MAEAPTLRKNTDEAARRDAEARNVIQTVLDENVMVLAGAGAGKTHEMITRMVERVKRGARVDQLVAITFTRKAAGEMRGRFFSRMQDEQSEASPDARKHLEEALRSIDQCFIGTIHSFCGRLLRERPAEAGVPPDFAEVDEREEQRLRRKAWRAYLETCDPGLLEELDDYGLKPRDLFDFFGDLCVFSDLELHCPEACRPDLEAGVERVLRFVEAYRPYVPERPIQENGYDEVQKALIDAKLFLAHNGLHTDGDRAHLLKLFSGLVASDKEQGKVKLNRWGERRSDGYHLAKEIRDTHAPELVRAIAPIVEAWEAYIYPRIAAFCLPAVEYYEQMRRAEGKLTFQDLLFGARDLLRDHPRVRRFFQDKYRYLHVDEFQDTDPVQAEILFYLTDTERLEEKDWTKLRPEPGRLFLVGDGKQSIYRFRRADYETFLMVQQRLQEHGRVVTLQRSFRARENLCHWANGAFPELFGEHGEPHQAPFDDLVHWEEKSDGHDLPRVRTLTTDYKYRNDASAICEDEAPRIAAFIAALVRGEGDVMTRYVEQGILSPDLGYGDFMILTRTKSRLHIYAEALEELGIPYDISGAGMLGDVEEVAAFMQMLEAVYDPDDAVALLAYLRGPLAGLSDQDLLAFHRAGGTFNYQGDVPGGLDPDVAERFTSAFGWLRRAETWLTSMPPSAALERLLDGLGLIVHAATLSGGSSRAGSLLKVLSICRSLEAGGADWIEVFEELREIVRDDGYKVEGLTLESGAVDDRGRPEAVRIMNLHQAKGLEAKVVFLAEPYNSKDGDRTPHFHVSRVATDEPVVALAVGKVPPYKSSPDIICRPGGWAEFEAEEQRFLEAEERRLLYVAATRAEQLLVVSRYKDKHGNVLDGYWKDLHDALEHAPELETCPESKAEPERWGVDLAVVEAEQAQRWQRLKESTYVQDRVSGGGDGFAYTSPPEPEGGTAFGRVVHRLFEAVLAGRVGEDQAASYVERLLEEEGASPEQRASALAALDGFLTSTLGRRVLAARENGRPVLTEVPFAGGSAERVVRGTMDLVARLEDGWYLVDFKTDSARKEAAIENVTRRYAAQVGTYARAWEEATGEPVTAAGLWLTAANRFVEVDGR